MTVPLIILAGFAILLGVIGTPAWPWFDGYLNGEANSNSISASSPNSRRSDGAFPR